jgi:hypothetical protein
MLRMMLRQDGPNRDAKFAAMLQEFAETYGGRAASLWDFEHIAKNMPDRNSIGFSTNGFWAPVCRRIRPITKSKAMVRI